MQVSVCVRVCALKRLLMRHRHRASLFKLFTHIPLHTYMQKALESPRSIWLRVVLVIATKAFQYELACAGMC